MGNWNTKIFLTGLIVTLLLITGYAHAAITKKPAKPALFMPSQTPEILVTWKAGTYTPRQYNGKALATSYTPIVASMEVLDNGAAADLTNTTVIWYINDEFYKSGNNLKSVVFSTPKFPGNKIFVRAEIQNYKNQDILKTVEIPTVAPEVIIETSYPYNTTPNTTVSAHATPYFFTVKKASDLVYAWQVNDTDAQTNENPTDLLITTGKSAKTIELNITLVAKVPGATSLFSSTANHTTIRVTP